MEEKNELILQERDYSTQILGIIRSDSTDEEIKTQLQEYHENDIASIFEELETEERDKLLQILGSEFMSEIVSYLEDAGEYLSEIDADDAAEIIEQMDADDAVEVLDDLEHFASVSYTQRIYVVVKADAELIAEKMGYVIFAQVYLLLKCRKREILGEIFGAILNDRSHRLIFIRAGVAKRKHSEYFGKE